MSHEATNWAIKVRGLKPIARIVLWHLADCHNPAMGCFPSQEYLAENCEIARSSVNRCLDDLEARGLIRRVARLHETTKRQLSTRYFLACEKGFHTQDVAGRVSGSDTEFEVYGGGKLLAGPVENDASRVPETPPAVSQSSETLTFKKPSTPLDPLPDFPSLVGSWPPVKVEEVKCARAFQRLDATDQRMALDMAGRYRFDIAGLGREIPRLENYLRRKLWEEFVGAPNIERGRFRIERGTAEWSAWVAHYQAADVGPTFLSALERQSFTRETTRWPPVAPTVNQKLEEEDA